MPYIKQEDRKKFDAGFLELQTPETAGELNYLITLIVKDYIGNNLNYTKLNEAIGVLECAKLELYRRVVSGYENSKIKENGDVYT